MRNLFLALLTSLFAGKKVKLPMPSKLSGGLQFIKMLVEKGKFKPLIDRRYPLDQVVEAYSYVATGQKIGDVIISIHEI